ncbi:MAG: type II toxin-antitoxin system RelE/ParE family toxin [Erysipelotrichaceae bacterium]|nr:type II toxin-antitoxin system RelE/ParE family toxin [Erysipelotrichaceae bacterium]
MIQVEFYETEDGKCPVQEYLDSLEPKILAKTLRSIDLLADNGPLLRNQFSKSVGKGLFELRTKYGSNITRIIYFFFKGNKAILTNGFTKKSQKLPSGVLEKALKYRKDYEERFYEEI